MTALPVSLTQDELLRVKESWRTFMENSRDNAITIFSMFLEKHNYYDKFPKFAGLSKVDLPNNSQYLYHTAAIVSALDVAIAHLSHQNTLKNILLQLGMKHSKKHITETQFHELKNVILDFMKERYRLQEPSLKAWMKAFENMYFYIFEGLKVEK